MVGGRIVSVPDYKYARIFIRKIDELNEGLFVKQKKDGQLVEVQIA